MYYIPRVDFIEDLFICGVIITHQLTIFDTEAVPPEGKVPDSRFFLWFWGRIGVGYEGTFNFIASECVSPASKS